MNNWKNLFASLFFLYGAAAFSHAVAQGWQPVQGKIMTPWAEKVNPAAPLPEYPRPQLVRGNWQNLNGLWDYHLSPADQKNFPAAWDGKILVPFPLESALSGVGKQAGKEKALWYKKEIEINAAIRKSQDILLHFGAVDWRCEVYVNGQYAGIHEGGYDPFSFSITPYLKKGNRQEIVIRVWDPTDDGPQPRGKQVNKPGGIWYTPVTGIWQTVWIEGVNKNFIRSLRTTPDIDRGILNIDATVQDIQPGDQLQVTVWDGKTKIMQELFNAGQPAQLSITNPKLWSPAQPFLYDMQVTLLRRGKKTDEVQSYFAMRKISMKKDAAGIQRMQLNNQFLFQYGPLDQGWWPDGLYTAPTDEALLYDVEQTKAMGFNMIRKHVKTEPLRWYHHCDKAGLLVWQDMPSGDMGGNGWDMRPGQITGRQLDKDRSDASAAIFKREWKAIMDALYSHPSVVVWVPFNEAWGQFSTKEITEWTMQADPSRLVNESSGGNFFYSGHILDIHHYPGPEMPSPEIFGSRQTLVLGEFGGLGLPLEGHTWQDKNNWGYQSFKSADELKKQYESFIGTLAKQVAMGLSAAVYTQTTDVEVETNGLMTYDRKVMKIPAGELKRIHAPLYLPVKE